MDLEWIEAVSKELLENYEGNLLEEEKIETLKKKGYQITEYSENGKIHCAAEYEGLSFIHWTAPFTYHLQILNY